MSRFAQRFVLEREIGAGGMSRVFLGRDEVLDRLVAVKILNPLHGGTDIGARFQREGRTAARLSHPNIVPVYDAGEAEFEGREVLYIVMEYIPGGDLKALIDEKGPLPNEELTRLGTEVSSGLAHAHERGVIHRDIKPHNILIDEYGRPKLTDFGIARALDTTTATRTGSYLGTALYSSPEQLRGEKVTPKSDIYSLGATLYQAAVGKAPFTGTPIAVASQHVSQTPALPSGLGAHLSGEAEVLILDCLHKDPDQRPTAEEACERFLDAAEIVRPAQVQAPPPPVDEPSPLVDTHTAPPEVTSEAPSGGRTRTDDLTVTRSAPLENSSAGPLQGGMRREGEQSRQHGPILFVVAALLLIGVGIATAFSTLWDGSDETAQSLPDEGSQASSSGEQEAASVGDEEITPAQEETGQGSNSDGGSTSDAASQTVEDYYTAATDGNYLEAWNFLSSGYQQQFSSREAYTSQFDTLESIEFIEGPTAQVSGNTATVTGVTIARHTDRTEQNRGTWTLVNENGGWKISGQDVSNISTQPV